MVRRVQGPQVEELVKTEDPAAFMIVTSASEIYGEGYKDFFAEKLYARLPDFRANFCETTDSSYKMSLHITQFGDTVFCTGIKNKIPDIVLEGAT